MDTTLTLSKQLEDLGFFNALGTHETSGRRVQKDTSCSIGYRNGVLVIYDENGEPWIMTNHHPRFREAEQAHYCRRLDSWNAVWVPHTNDGGQFVNEVLPTLYRGW